VLFCRRAQTRGDLLPLCIGYHSELVATIGHAIGHAIDDAITQT
jgi:hypothetical protein